MNLILEKGYSERGADMGRRNQLPADPSQPVKLQLQKLKWVDSDYDQGGAYWGNSGDFIYCAFTEGVRVFARAKDRDTAKRLVLEEVPGAEFHDGAPAPAAAHSITVPGLHAAPLPERLREITLLAPFEISARLLPGLRVGKGAWISLEHSPLPGRNGGVRYRYFIDIGDKEFSGEDLFGACGGSLQEGFGTLLACLAAAAESYAESYAYRQRTGRVGDNEDLFPPEVVEWAYQNSDELGMLSCDIEKAGLILE